MFVCVVNFIWIVSEDVLCLFIKYFIYYRYEKFFWNKIEISEVLVISY